MDGFKDVPNIGKVLKGILETAEIKDIEQLRQLGTQAAYIKIKTVYPDACLSMLYAVEGAVQNKRWHDIEESKRDELRVFYAQFKKS